MDTRSALTFAAYYHVVALFASLLGFGIAAAGVVVGLGDALTGVSLLDPTTYFAGVSPAGIGVATAGVVAGLLVRRIGRTAAYLKAQTEAVERDVSIPSTEVVSARVGESVSNDVLEVVETVVDVEEIRPAGDVGTDDGASSDPAEAAVTVDPTGGAESEVAIESEETVEFVEATDSAEAADSNEVTTSEEATTSTGPPQSSESAESQVRSESTESQVQSESTESQVQSESTGGPGSSKSAEPSDSTDSVESAESMPAADAGAFVAATPEAPEPASEPEREPDGSPPQEISPSDLVGADRSDAEFASDEDDIELASDQSDTELASERDDDAGGRGDATAGRNRDAAGDPLAEDPGLSDDA